MNVAVLLEGAAGTIKKTSLEAAIYAAKVAGGQAVGIALGSLSATALAEAGQYGLSKIIHIADAAYDNPSAAGAAHALKEALDKAGADVLVMAKSTLADTVGGRLAAKWQAGLVNNVVALPDTGSGFVVRQSIFTGKAFADTELTTAKKILIVKKNVIAATPQGTTATVELFTPSGTASVGVTSKGIEKAGGDILLTEADIVVSGGRGMKGADQWQPLLDLASALGAGTACSKPVSDMDWRPHHEHVGQTGVKISPSLYIAVGISGAIQHLAGVSSSKVIVVINKDPEAPFFKAADYGIVGDAFEVLPKLTAAVKAAK